MVQPVQVLAYTGTYLLTCMRYIELNPVRATMAEDPAHYRWISYRANALGQTSPLLVPHSVYLPLLRPTKHGKPPTFTYSGIISTKKWSANCDWRSTKTSPSGTECVNNFETPVAGGLVSNAALPRVRVAWVLES